MGTRPTRACSARTAKAMDTFQSTVRILWMSSDVHYICFPFSILIPIHIHFFSSLIISFHVYTVSHSGLFRFPICFRSGYFIPLFCAFFPPSSLFLSYRYLYTH
ncbi:hypothetical protein ARMSODRAFT_669984 [Armillaria solidipes]|uniref:Uncharacterized protein n=1 Tax=Armillaria solidipes TaxID=1076256 RepID=A0A2H3B245_9AGAR|nr:hypothetical protein ARMSODRAFT_669984 [Armillaria solidipes]